MKTVVRKDARCRRHARLRQSIVGTASRPRMCVMVSGHHLYVQFIDDERGVTLAAVSTKGANAIGRKNVGGAKEVGRRAAELAQAKGIAAVIFDRGGYRYHGRIKALADAAREAGLKF